MNATQQVEKLPIHPRGRSGGGRVEGPLQPVYVEVVCGCAHCDSTPLKPCWKETTTALFFDARRAVGAMEWEYDGTSEEGGCVITAETLRADGFANEDDDNFQADGGVEAVTVEDRLEFSRERYTDSLGDR
jgi:hypothetical protein